MSNTFGKHLRVTLFGESHGPAIGCVVDGLPGGVKIDEEYIAKYMGQRMAVGAISTGRKEPDRVKILSGVKNGFSEGTPIALLIENTNVHSSDYNDLKDTARPGHADYAGHLRYNGFEDASGGGHFSGRLTAPLVAAGSVARRMLEEKGITIGSHIASLHGIKDSSFEEDRLEEQVEELNDKIFAVLDDTVEQEMLDCILSARENQDSVGGILDTAVCGMPGGIGDPEFDSIEAVISHAMFSIPAVKGIAFGEGYGFADLYGSEANDPFRIKDGKVVTETNRNGGINGGITNGMPIRFTTVIKPTPSISKEQKTVNFEEMTEKDLVIHGRHDPAIIHRARVVVDSMTALSLADALMERYGAEYFGGEK